jgi:hypothetical protein
MDIRNIRFFITSKNTAFKRFVHYISLQHIALDYITKYYIASQYVTKSNKTNLLVEKCEKSFSKVRNKKQEELSIHAHQIVG